MAMFVTVTLNDADNTYTAPNAAGDYEIFALGGDDTITGNVNDATLTGSPDTLAATDFVVIA